VLAGDPRYVADPWADWALQRPFGGQVLLIGSGLTAVDVALTLSARRPDVRIVAVSRHGLRPLAHRAGGAPSDPPAVTALRPHSTLGLLRTVRAEVALTAARGGDWRDVVNRLRPVTQELWQALPHTERHRFVHRLARFWEVHRHRLAPQVGAAVERLEREGRLAFAAGRITDLAPATDGVRVRVILPGGGERELDVGLVVNCTGAGSTVVRDPLLGRMEATGLCAPGPLGLGIATLATGEVLDRDGRPTGLFALGPLRRGELWETTAIPEIRAQAFALAEELAARFAAPTGWRAVGG
jgi:uncharacterized NAD(P)/FAD-binding protein YdhS